MRLRKISGKNIKGDSFSHDLGPLVYVVGDNGVGKSRVGDTITLALSGYHPNIGGKSAKTNESVMQLASGDEMSVQGVFDGDQIAARCWKRGKNGKVSKTETFTGLDDGWTVPPVLLDIHSYLEKSDEARVQTVFDLATVKDFDLTAASLAAKMKNIKLEENTEHSETVIGEIIELVYSGWKQKDAAGENIQQFLSTFGEALAQRLKDATQSVKRMNLTVQGLEQLKAEAALAKAPPDPATDRKLAQARARRDELLTNKATIEEAGKLARAEAERLAEIDRLLAGSTADQLMAKRGEVERLRGQIAAFKSETTAVRGQIDKAAADRRTIQASQTTANERLAAQRNKQTRRGHLAAVSSDLIPLTADYKAKEERHDRLDADIAGYASKTGELRKKWQDAHGAWVTTGNDAKLANDQIAKNEAELTDLDALDTCPYCKSCGDGWRDRLRSLLNSELSDLRTKRDRLVESVAKLHTVADAANALLKASEAADERHEEMKNERMRAELERAHAGKKLDDATKAALDLEALGDCSDDEAKTWVTELQAGIEANDALKKVLATRLGQCEADDKAAAEWPALLKTAEDELAPLECAYRDATALRGERRKIEGAQQKVDDLLAQHATVKEMIMIQDDVIKSYEEEQRRAVAARADSAKKAEALVAATKAQAEIEATKQALDIISDERARIVEKAFEPILEVANRMATPLLGAPLVYQDAKIGRMVKGRFVGQATFSGFQRSVVCCAMSVALAAQSPVKIAIIDEVDISQANRSNLVRIVESLVSNGTIDQAVVIGTSIPAEAALNPEKWTVIEL